MRPSAARTMRYAEGERYTTDPEELLQVHASMAVWARSFRPSARGKRRQIRDRMMGGVWGDHRSRQGRASQKVVPVPTDDSTVRVPPCASTIRWER